MTDVKLLLQNSGDVDGRQRARVSYDEMRRRCYSENFKAYPNYGGRGIKVCDRWLEPNGQGFINFYQDMGSRPVGLTLDRVDVNGNYEPSNCRWATRKEQVQNRTVTLFVCFRGEKVLLTNLCEEFQIDYMHGYHSVSNGIVDEAKFFNTKRSRDYSKILFNGEVKSLKEWANVLGVSYVILYKRLNRGYSVEEALSVPPFKPKTLTIDGIEKPVKDWCDIHNINYNTYFTRVSGGMSEIEALLTPLKRKHGKSSINKC